MTYYIEKENKIVLHDTNLKRLQTTLKFMPQFKGLEVKETERPIENCQFADTDSYLAKKQKHDIESTVASMEADTGLTRVMRELVLADDSNVSDYVKQKAQEIEELAEQLRAQ